MTNFLILHHKQNLGKLKAFPLIARQGLGSSFGVACGLGVFEAFELHNLFV